MGAWSYCIKCDSPLQSPWDKSTEEILTILLLKQDGNCPQCGTELSYNNEELVSIVAERIDKKETTNGNI